MPPLRLYSAPPLEDLCLSAVIRCLETDLILCEVAKTLQENSLLLRRRDLSIASISRELKNYMGSLPGILNEIVRQKITDRILKKYTCLSQPKPNTLRLPLHTMTVRMLEVVLDEEVHTFDISEFQPKRRTAEYQPEPGAPEVWQLVLGRCTGLRKFCLPPLLCHTLHINMNEFLESLAFQCNQLTEIVLKDAVVHGKVLAAIGKHCPSVRTLDISGSNVTCSDLLLLIFPGSSETSNSSLSEEMTRRKCLAMQPLPIPNQAYNPLCITMRELLLTETKVRALGAYYILKFMPNITSLGDFAPTTAGIKKFCQECKESKCKFSLKQVFYRSLSCDKIKLICETCPDLEILHLGSDDAKRLNFKYLSKLPKLRSLIIEMEHFVDICPELVHLKHIRELQLQVKNVDVGVIVESCPLLQKLVITLEPQKSVSLSYEKEKELLPHLEELQLECRVSMEAAALLLTQSPRLKVVKIVRVMKLTDKVLDEWMDINPFKYLETLLIGFSNLTARSVRQILWQCKRLTTLGRLSGWDVRSWESRQIKRAWNRHDINLVHFSHKQNDVSKIMAATASSDDEIQ